MPQATKPRGCAISGVAIVGAGRLGSALARALRAAGVAVEGPLGRGAIPAAEVVLVCVPDGQIAAAAEALRRPRGSVPLTVGHVSGATPLTALAPAGCHVFGLHPLQTFTGGEGPEAFAGVGAAVAGGTPEALAVARGLAGALGMRPIEISDAERAAYHAAAAVASNFVVTLQSVAERLAGAAGIGPADARALLAPLVRQTVENWCALGPERALTGPVARGDRATVARHRDAVDRHAPELLDLYDELVAATITLASPSPTGQVPAGGAVPSRPEVAA